MELWSFIDKVVPEQVGFVRSTLGRMLTIMLKTLACDIVLVNGVITVKPHWCAYKDQADEVISTLLVPLHLKLSGVRLTFAGMMVKPNLCYKRRLSG